MLFGTCGFCATSGRCANEACPVRVCFSKRGQFRAKFLYPAIHYCRIACALMFCEQIAQTPMRQQIAAIPTNRPQDHFLGKGQSLNGSQRM